MKAITIAIGIGAAALLSGAPAQASSNIETNASASVPTVQDTDMSAHRRHWRRYRVVRVYQPYYRSYGYHHEPSYYRPAPPISFGFGFGGPLSYGHHHHGHHHHHHHHGHHHHDDHDE